MQVTLYTKQTAPHAPVVALLDGGRARRWEARNFSLDTWYKDHAEKTPEEVAEKLKWAGTYQWPPCASCDWDWLQRNQAAARERREIKRRLAVFEKTGKLPPKWMEPPPAVKFGGALMSDKEARRVVLPVFPRVVAGSASFLSPKEKTLDRDKVTRLYLDMVNKKGSRIFATPEQDRNNERVRQWACGCRITERRYSGSYQTQELVPCRRHKPALEGRDDE